MMPTPGEGGIESLACFPGQFLYLPNQVVMLHFR